MLIYGGDWVRVMHWVKKHKNVVNHFLQMSLFISLVDKLTYLCMSFIFMKIDGEIEVQMPLK